MNLSKKDSKQFNFSKIAKKAFAILLCAISLAACSKNAKANGVNSQPGDFYVISCDPVGKLPSEVRFPSIYVQFSEPVVALEKLGEQSDKSDVFSIEPKIDGVFRWYGTSLLAFECADAVVPQMEYKIKVNGNLKSINGTQLTGGTEYSFTTEELKITNFVPGYSARKEENTISSEDYYDYFYSPYDLKDLDLTSAADLAVFFNYPVNAAVTGSFIEVRDGSGKVYKTETSAIEGENGLLVKVKDSMPEDTDFELVLKEGACSEKGYLGKSEEQVKEFHTLTPFKFNYDDSDRRSYGKYSNPVFLYFSHRIDPNAAEWVSKNVKTTPSMAISAENVSISGNSVMIHSLPVTFEQTYTLSIAAGLKDAYGRTTKDATEIKVTVPSAASMATFKDYGHGILEAQFEPKLAFQYQNILDGSYYEVGGETVTYDSNNVPKNTRVTEVVDLAPYLKKIKDRYFGHVNFSARMNVKSNYDSDYTYSQENHQVIQVTNLGATVRYAYNKAVIMVTQLDTGKPVANADVAFLLVPGNKDNWTVPMEIILDEVSQFDKDYRGYGFTPMGVAKTDSNGLAVIDFNETEKYTNAADSHKGKPITLGDVINGYQRYNWTPIVEVVSDGDRLVFNPNITYMWSTGANYCREATSGDVSVAKTFMFTDRGLYKPGEKLSFRGVDCNLKLSKYSAYTGAYNLKIREARWNGKEIYNTEGSCTENGSFWGSVQLPQDLEPGSYQIVYERDGTNKRTFEYFSVAYFERLRFSASASIADQTYVRGDRVDATVNAEYLGGGSLGGCTFTASWFREPTYFSINKNEFAGWRFGPIQGYDNRSFLGRENGVLGSNGSGSVSTTSGGEQLKGMAYQYRTEMRVSDSAGQEISAKASTIVHPAAFYIGLSPAKNLVGFATKGKELNYDFKLVQPNGSEPLDNQLPIKKADKKIKLELMREEWKIVQQMGYGGTINTRYVKEMVSEITKDIDLQNSGSFNFTVPKGGAYILRLSTTDRKGNDVVTERRFYASGSEWRYFGSQSEEINLLCDKDEYAEGETAKIMLQSPLEKGTYLITVERDSIISQEVRTFDQSVNVIEQPIKAEYLPVVYVSVSSFSLRSGEPAEDYDSPDLNKPKGYFGVVPVHVNTEGKSMDLAISTNKPSYKPGEEATVTLKVSRGGVPVEGAELAFMAVDRGVIDLIDYHVPDPMKFFYSESNFPLACNGGDSRSLLIDPVRYAAKNLFGGDADGEDDDKMNERKNFDPTAIFEPCLITDETGVTSAVFKWPDTLTTYRMTAFGIKDDHFAIKESEVNVANPISVREVLPRRLRVGDISEAGVVISNLEANAQNVTVSMEIFEGVEKSGQAAEVDGIVKQPGKARMIGKTEETVKVGANTSLPVMFPFEAQNDGYITIQFTVKSSLVNERILKPLQIDRPIIYETVVTTGETGDDKQAFAKEQVKLPAVFDKSYGSLSLTLDATRLGVLKEAVNYCFRYPYGCLEQRSSAILPLVLFSDYIKAFDLNNEVKNPKKVIEKEIKDWGKYQKASGAFPYWPSGYYESLPVTLRIAEITGLSQQKGYSTNAIDTKKLFQYIETQIDLELAKETPNTAMVAYASYVLTCFESKQLRELYKESEVIKDALSMVEKSENHSISDLCYVALTYKNLNKDAKALEVLKRVQNYFKPTTRGLDITDPGRCSYWYWFGGNSDAYALALKAYSAINPESDYLGRLVFELLQIQKAHKGYWRSTANTARVLDGFATYIEALNLEKTDFTAEALIAGNSVAVNKFKGLGAEPMTKTFDFNDKAFEGIKEDSAFDVEFSKKGTGNLFYTVILKYPLWANEMTARDEGLCVFMEYVDIETGKTVAAEKLESGKTYKAKVTVSSTKDRTFVALRAPIPAGCEVLNAAFVTTGTYADYAEEPKESSDNDYDYYDYYYDDYYEDDYYFNMLSNQTIYDNEVQYFWDDFPRGRQSVDFLFRAVRKGTYQTPSATVECMYEPEIFGRSAGKVWKVE